MLGLTRTDRTRYEQIRGTVKMHEPFRDGDIERLSLERQGIYWTKKVEDKVDLPVATREEARRSMFNHISGPNIFFVKKINKKNKVLLQL